MSKIVHIAGAPIGGSHFTTIAGPCAVESRSMALDTALTVREAGAAIFRGGAFKPRSSPRSFQGLGVPALDILQEVKTETGMPVVTELTDVRDLDRVLGVVDAVQVGARNMHNYPLLAELGRTDIPVILKRGLAATIDELLLAAEYVLSGGNENVILCERGIRTFETAYRFTLDVGAVAVVRERTQLPIIVDPSHAAGRRGLVLPFSLAALAAGADGLIVEVHPDPSVALCDGAQAVEGAGFDAYLRQVHNLALAVGRSPLEPVGASSAASFHYGRCAADRV